MIWIILAAGLGLQLIIVTLLFRRLRGDLNRQLRDLRAERNSEWILRALKEAPESRQQAVQAANGSGLDLEPPRGVPQPVHRKKHLGLFIGGAVVALVVTLGQTMRDLWQLRRGQVIGAVAGVATASTTAVALLAYGPWEDDSHSPPSSAPTAEPTPSYTKPPPPSGPTPPPSSSTSPPIASESSRTGSASPVANASVVPIVAATEAAATPSQSKETLPGDASPPAPETSSSTGPGPSEPPAEETPRLPATSGMCADLPLPPLIAIKACLRSGGGS